MISNVLQIKNLQKGFKDTQVVNLSSLSVQQGEIYGFLGPNGAGKTTTMKMILSLISRTAGEIEVFGQPIGTDKQYLNQIGSMIEEPSYYPNLTGYENLLVFQKILGFDKKNIQETLKIVGLDQPKNKKKLVKDYSLGMKQRLALAFALVKKPRLLILDEPTNGLDPAGIHEIRELIIKLAKEQGITVFISTHILSEVELSLTVWGLSIMVNWFTREKFVKFSPINGWKCVGILEIDVKSLAKCYLVIRARC